MMAVGEVRVETPLHKQMNGLQASRVAHVHSDLVHDEGSHWTNTVWPKYGAPCAREPN